MACFLRGVVSVPLSLAVLGAAPALAATPARHVEMAWSQDDPTCIGAADLTRMIEATLARPVFHSDAPPAATVRGAVGKAGPGRFEAHIALLGADGRVVAERALSTSGDCGRLDESVAVVVTLMIDGMEETPTPLLVPAAPPRPTAPPAAPATPREAPARLAIAFGLGAGVSSSLLPGVVPSFGVRGEIGVARFVSIAGALHLHAPSSTLVAGVGGGRFSATTGELEACPAWSRGRVRLGGCAGLGGGAIEGDGIELVDGESHLRPLVMATLLPFAAVRLAGPLWIRAEAGAWFPLLREPWGYLDPRGAFEEVFRPAPVVPVAMLTLELRTGS